jgi:hypothetical protein
VTAVLSLLFCGCAARKNVGSPGSVHGELVVDRACMESVSLTDATECRMKLDEKTLHCTGLKLVKYPKCERLEVNPKQKEVK